MLPPHCWTNYPGELFNVRAGPNYAKTGNKQPSLESLYEVFAVDAYNTQGKMPHIGKDVELPPYNGTKLSLPEFIIINLMVPGYAPSYAPVSRGELLLIGCAPIPLLLHVHFGVGWVVPCGAAEGRPRGTQQGSAVLYLSFHY